MQLLRHWSQMLGMEMRQESLLCAMATQICQGVHKKRKVQMQGAVTVGESSQKVSRSTIRQS